jgi:hypothetical protein
MLSKLNTTPYRSVLTITIESTDELLNLWHRFNLSDANIRAAYTDGRKPNCPTLNHDTVWGRLEAEVERLGLTPINKKEA